MRSQTIRTADQLGCVHWLLRYGSAARRWRRRREIDNVLEDKATQIVMETMTFRLETCSTVPQCGSMCSVMHGAPRGGKQERDPLEKEGGATLSIRKIEKRSVMESITIDVGMFG